jgi:hypothetical protein
MKRTTPSLPRLLPRLRGRRDFSQHPDDPDQEAKQHNLFHLRLELVPQRPPS